MNNFDKALLAVIPNILVSNALSGSSDEPRLWINKEVLIPDKSNMLNASLRRRDSTI